MKGKNKKTKIAAKKSSAKSGTFKKPIKKAANRRKISRPVKTESILGSVAAPQAESLGTKILVQEITEEPKIAAADLAMEETTIPQENFTFPAEEMNEDFAEQIDSQNQEDIQIQNQNSPEAYYAQKEMSQRQKTIIMYVSLTAIMGVLVFFWGLSIKNSFSQSIIKTSGTGDDSQQLFNEFQGFFADFQDSMANINNQNQDTQANQVLDEMKQKIINDKVKDDIANQLKEKLENLNTNSENTNNTNINLKY